MAPPHPERDLARGGWKGDVPWTWSPGNDPAASPLSGVFQASRARLKGGPRGSHGPHPGKALCPYPPGSTHPPPPPCTRVHLQDTVTAGCNLFRGRWDSETGPGSSLSSLLSQDTFLPRFLKSTFKLFRNFQPFLSREGRELTIFFFFFLEAIVS